jgi:hypothetical protein
LVDLVLASHQDVDFLLRLDAHRFEDDDDGDVFRQDVVLEVNAILFQDNIRLRLALVRGTFESEHLVVEAQTLSRRPARLPSEIRR